MMECITTFSVLGDLHGGNCGVLAKCLAKECVRCSRQVMQCAWRFVGSHKWGSK